MRYCAIFKVNPVIFEVVSKEDISKIKKKDKNKAKKSKFNDILVKFMFNHRIWEHIKYKYNKIRRIINDI